MSSSIDTHQAWYARPAASAGGAISNGNRDELAFSDVDEAPAVSSGFSFFGDDGVTFGDLIDIINPLQHLPLVSTMYRELTGDTLSPGPRLVGSSLFFGPIGFASALANVFVEDETGKDIGEHVADWVMPTDGQPGAEPPTAIAGAGGPFDMNDPVSVWARGEKAWVEGGGDRQNVPIDQQAEAAAIPDASAFVRDDEQWAAAPAGLAEIVSLTADARSASLAYEAAAGLRPHVGS